MADLKELLGDAYKDDMTLEDINEALSEKEFIGKESLSEYVPKNIADKYATEAAEYKKKWKAVASEQEQKQIEDAEKQAQIEEELKTLRRASKVSEFEKQHLALNYEEKDAKEIAEALYDGDMDTVFRLQKKHDEALRKSVKSELMKDMPAPPSGNQATVDYSKQIEAAQANGDMALMASLIRQQAEANESKK